MAGDQNTSKQNVDFDSPEFKPIARLAKAVEEVLPTIDRRDQVQPQQAQNLKEAYNEVTRKFPDIHKNINTGGMASSGRSESSRSSDRL